MTAQVRVALLVASAASFLNPYMVGALNVALPAVGRDLHANAVTLSWLTTSYLLATVVCLVPLGRVADLYGRKRVFTAGVVLFMISSALCAAAPTAAALIACRIFQGAASAMIYSNGVAILTSVCPPALRGRMLGITVACVYTGSSLGPVIGGVLTQYAGWRAVFLGAVPIGLAVYALATGYLAGDAGAAAAAGIDGPGVILYGTMFIGVITGLATIPAPASAALIAAGVAAAVLFVRWSADRPSAVLDVRRFRTNRVFALSSLAALLNYAAGAPTAFLLSLYLQYVDGLTPGQAGAILIAQPVMQAALSPVAGWLSDRIEPRIVASTGMAMTSGGLAALAALHPHAAAAYVIAALVVMGAGFGLFSSPNTNAIMSAVPPSAYGMAAGVTSTVRITGQMLSLAAITLIFQAFLGAAAVSAANLGAFEAAARAGFLVFAAACGTGVLASLARGNVRAPGRRGKAPRDGAMPAADARIGTDLSGARGEAEDD